MKLLTAAAVLLLVVGCSTEEQPQATPQEVVAGWLDALASGEGAADYVVPGQVDVLAAVERRAEAGGILVEGLTSQAEADYWAAFAASTESFLGIAFDDLEVGPVATPEAEGSDYAYVEVLGPEGEAIAVVLQGGGPWRIDIVATVGPGLVRPLRSMIETVGMDAPGVAGRRSGLAASLRAGLEDPAGSLPPEFRDDVTELIDALEG